VKIAQPQKNVFVFSTKISLSATPVLSVMSSYEISFQILFWQSGGALLASCAGSQMLKVFF